MKLTIEKLDALKLSSVFINLKILVFPADEIVSNYNGTSIRISIRGKRILAYVGRYCVSNFNYISLGKIDTKAFGLAGKILEFFHALQNRPISYEPEIWNADCETFFGKAPDLIWDARKKIRINSSRHVIRKPRGRIKRDRFIPVHEARRQVLEKTALARDLRIDEFLPNGYCIAWVPIKEFWQGPCRRKCV
jgi:hypothetical protein